MSYSASHNNVFNGASPRPSTSNSVRRDAIQAVGKLTIRPSAATGPQSPQALSPARIPSQRANSGSSPNGKLPPKSPLHRSPSSMSQHSRSSTPTLLRKVSMNSLHGVGGITPSRASSSRRSSSAQFSNASTMVGRSPLSELEDQIPPPPKYTPESIARNHFEAELETHKAENGTKNADTVVILHDSCYGHRFSRPRTSKAMLSSIVERPERINASILGISMAYVWLGDRHADGYHPPHPRKNPAEIPDVPFKILKTDRRLPLSAQAVTNVHGAKWMEELKIMCNNAESKLAGNGKELTRPDMPRGSAEKPAEFHEGDLYLCSESLNAMEGALGAVCEGVDAVFQGASTGQGPFRTFVVIRPPGHHCSASYPSGFCWVNNVHVGIQHAAITHGLTHAAIIDFDLHHGDGSQAIARETNRRAATAARNSLPWKKISIGYFSLHDINSYPCEQGDEEKVTNASVCIENAHNQSIWNVHLQPWKSEAEFWELYETRYSILLEKTRNYLRAQTDRLRLVTNGPKPKGAIFLSAGFDASEWESSGMQRHKVNVPTEFYARLTRDVVRLAAEEGCAVEGRIISVLEGGYSDRALSTGVLSHLSGMAAGEAVVIKKEPSPNGLGYEMCKKIGTFDGHKKRESVTLGKLTYDPSWWSVQRLEQLDAIMNPSPVGELKKQRDLTPPTYSSPTQSFIAKVNVTPRRSSSISKMANGSPRTMSRPPSPPPPEVDWTVAAHELSKLLIPTGRTTMSCRPEELATESTRGRRERQPVSEVELANSMNQMTLRTRGTTKALAETAEEHEFKQPAPRISRSDRRKTDIGTVNLNMEQAISGRNTPIPVPGPAYSRNAAPLNRRASIASTSGSAVSEVQGPVVRGRRVTSRAIPPALSRPTTAQSIRPESSASVRAGPTAAVIVKKTRAPAQPRIEAAKAPRRKKSPLNDSGLVPDDSISPPSVSSSTLVPKTKIAPMPKSAEGSSHSQPPQSLQKDVKVEKAKAKSRPTPLAPTVKPTKKHSSSEVTTKSTVDVSAPNNPSSVDSSKAEKKKEKKITINMRQLVERAKGVTNAESKLIASTTPNADRIPGDLSNGTGSLQVESSEPRKSMTSNDTNIDSLVEGVTAIKITSDMNLDLETQKKLRSPELGSAKLAHTDKHMSEEVLSTELLSNSETYGSSPPANSAFENLDPSESTDSSLPTSSPPNPSYRKFGDISSSSDGFIAYKPEGSPPVSIVQQQEQLRWLPPNTMTPSQIKKGDLPVFTSTGAIPFAMPKMNGAAKQP